MPEVGIRYFTYDGLNRRSSLKDEVGSVWYFDYDANSNLTSQLSPLVAQTSWGYDADNRKTFQQDPLARTWYWTYDPAGNASSLKDGRAQVTYYQYDSVNLRHRVDYPDLVSHYFEFDVARQLTAMADPSGRTVESYDNLGRLTLRTNPGSQNLYYEYDATSNRTNLKDPDGKAIYYIYDSANRLEHVEAPDYSGTVAYYQYTLADERNFERRKNGTLSYHTYDNAGRISAIEHRATAGIIEAWDYTRDEVGNILQQVRRTDSMNVYWNYDQASRITKEAWRSSGGSDVYGFAYTYDAAGNRNNKQKLLSGVVNTYWNYDLADQLVIQKNNADTRVYFEFDANGNLSVEHDVDASAGRTYYEYDPRNLLNKVDFPQAIATNYFYYNAPGERIRKDDSTGGKKYTWDALIPIVEKNLANSTTQRMVKGYTPIAGIGDYALQDVGGTVIYPHKNQVGTTMRSTDVSQVLKNTYEYDAWGQPFVASETVGQQYRFTGKELDPDFVDFNSVNFKYHFPNRSYIPFRSVFSTVDPLLLSRSLKKAKPSLGGLGSPLLPQAEAFALPTREDLLDTLEILRQLGIPPRVLEVLQRVVASLPSRAGRSKKLPIPEKEIIRYPYVYAIHRPTEFVDPAGLQEAMSESEADEYARRESEAPDLQEFRGGDARDIYYAFYPLIWLINTCYEGLYWILHLPGIYDLVSFVYRYGGVGETGINIGPVFPPRDPDPLPKPPLIPPPEPPSAPVGP